MIKQSTILQKRFFLPFNECDFSYKIFSHTWLAISSVDFFVHGITIIFIQILINIVIVIVIIIIINTKKL